MSARARVLDAMTVGLVAVALVVVVDRYRHRDGGRPDQPSTTAAERDLIGRRPEFGALGALGAQLDSALRSRGRSRALVLLYSETCPACLAARPTWYRVLASLGPGVAVHAVTGSSGSGSGGFIRSSLVSTWHATSGVAVARAFSVPWVPVTLVLSAAGTIEFARIGVLDSADADTLLALLRSSHAAASTD